jgi:protease-4
MQRRLLVLIVVMLVPLFSMRGLWAAPAADDKKEAAAAKEDKASKEEKQGPASVAVFKWNGELTEPPPQEELYAFGPPGESLKDLVARIRKAADDSKIKAVVLNTDSGALGRAQMEEVRQAIKFVRDHGKEVYVHSDSMMMNHYILACGASRISVVPTGVVWIGGLFGEQPYVRGLLDLLGVEPDFLTCGAYKSAAEIFMRKEPSPEADKMTNWLLDSIFETDIQLIAKGRGVPADKVKSWIDGALYTAEKAKAAGMIDAVESREAFSKLLKSKYGSNVVFEHKYGKKKPPTLDFSSPFGLLKFWTDLLTEGQKKKSTKAAIAIVYVNGPIVVGGGQTSPFGDSGEARSTDVRKALDEAAKDDAIKGVVLRVDSPGGSAVASDIILEASKRVKNRKPLIVSMGNVAGSGGYYVAMGADTIYADETTITGSIGVVSGKFATNSMWNKIGITFKSYKRGENAGFLSSEKVFTPAERDKMQGFMDEIYDVFKSHVVANRGKKLKKPIDELAGGRVYTGRQALDLGLVDKIGTLQDAIHQVAAEAKVTDYDVRVVPAPKNLIELIMEEAEGGKEDKREVDSGIRRPLGPRPFSLVDLALPYLQKLDPHRVKMTKLALQRMELIQREGAVLMMPEMRFGQ